jgi:hypothetical protein
LQKMTEANFILVHLVLFTVKPKNADYWRCIDSKAMSPYGNTKQMEKKS